MQYDSPEFMTLKWTLSSESEIFVRKLPRPKRDGGWRYVEGILHHSWVKFFLAWVLYLFSIPKYKKCKLPSLNYITKKKKSLGKKSVTRPGSIAFPKGLIFSVREEAWKKRQEESTQSSRSFKEENLKRIYTKEAQEASTRRSHTLWQSEKWSDCYSRETMVNNEQICNAV